MCLIRFIHLYWVSFPLWPSISRVYRVYGSQFLLLSDLELPQKPRSHSRPWYRWDKETFHLSASILSFLPTLTHSSFHFRASLCHKTQWVFHEKLQPHEYPSTPSSEISPASHSAWYLCLTFRHKPLRESARSNAIPSLLSIVFQSLHKWLTSQLLLSSRKSAGRFHTERAF